MPDTASRLLSLLALLQTRPSWTGPELAGRLGVSARTIRKDIDRLRSIGYPVHATRGTAGAYRLGAGTRLPPLLLTDEEAVAVAVGMRVATGVAGIQQSSASTAAKLEQVLPARLRRRVAALWATVDRGPDNTSDTVEDPQVDPEVLVAVADAIASSQLVRFDYDGATHTVEPYRLVNWQRRWFLVAREPQSRTWAPYRVDWVTPRMPTGRGFEPVTLPGGDYTAFVLREVASTGWAVHARITVLAPAAEVLRRINPTVGVVEVVDDTTCVLVTGADSLETIAVYVGMLGLDFVVSEPAELVEHVAALGERYRRAVPRTGPSEPATSLGLVTGPGVTS